MRCRSSKIANMSQEENEYLQERAKRLLRLLEEVMKSPRRASFVPELPEDNAVSEELAKLADFYVKEMGACLGAAAFLGANVVAVSTLEVLLLMRCLSDRSKVCGTKRWQSLQNKSTPKPFLTVLLKIHLRDLLFISDELSWFPKGGIPLSLRLRLAELFGNAAADKFSAPANATLSFSEFAVTASAELRNLLHPGRCVRIPVDPRQSVYSPVDLVDYLGMFGCACTLLALGSFLENQP